MCPLGVCMYKEGISKMPYGYLLSLEGVLSGGYEKGVATFLDLKTFWTRNSI